MVTHPYGAIRAGWLAMTAILPRFARWCDFAIALALGMWCL
jgi:hypothetical protein